jgi:hypothetical protein
VAAVHAGDGAAAIHVDGGGVAAVHAGGETAQAGPTHSAAIVLTCHKEDNFTLIFTADYTVPHVKGQNFNVL